MSDHVSHGSSAAAHKPAGASGAALGAQQCIFCQIATGKVNAQRIYDDDRISVVLDINPANPGHCLVITKQHYQVMPQIPDEVVGKMMDVVRQVSHAILRALKAQGTTIFVANGAVAGQRAPHFMLHIIPRVQGDGLVLEVPKNNYSLQEQSALKKRLVERVAAVFGPASIPRPPALPEKTHALPPVPAQQAQHTALAHAPGAQQPSIVVVEAPQKRPEPSIIVIENHRPVKLQDEPVHFIWQKEDGMHWNIRGLPIYDVAHVTRFIARHKELIAVVDALLREGPMHAIELQRVIDFKMQHLLALEYLGYIRPLAETDTLMQNIAKERTKNHPGRTFFAITQIGRRFLADPKHPPVISNAVKEKLILEELGVLPPTHAPITSHAPANEGQKHQRREPPSAEKFDLDALTDILAGK